MTNEKLFYLRAAMASVIFLIGLSGSVFAAGPSNSGVCALDKNGNGPRHCQCEALRHETVSLKILKRLSNLRVCDTREIGQGSSAPPSSSRGNDCDSGGEQG